MRKIVFLLAICLSATVQCKTALADTDKNVRQIIEAARKLEFVLPENRAYLLIKQEWAASPIGVIFGYVDNAAACDEIAKALSNSLGVGPFKCSPIE